MHAMLALAASDLATTSTPELASSAISHRLIAIKSLNKALSQGMHSFEESNAVLSTCYSLALQSVLIDDGPAEFMTFIRGLILVSTHMKCNNVKCLFKSLLGREQLYALEPHLRAAPVISPTMIAAACASLEALGLLCKGNPEIGFHALLLEMAQSLSQSPLEGTESSIPFMRNS
jgi:hypothetical protein